MKSFYRARWTVVRMFRDGCNKKSIAGLLKLSRQHVADIIKNFERDGFAGLEDKRSRSVNHPHNQLTMPFLDKVAEVQEAYPRLGRFRVHGLLEREMGDDTLSERSVGRAIGPSKLRRAFHHLQFSRTVNQHGYVSVQRFFINAEWGLARQRVAIWIYQNRLHIEHQQKLLARYSCRLDRKKK